MSSLCALAALAFSIRSVRLLDVADGAEEVALLLRRNTGSASTALGARVGEAAELAVRVLQAPTSEVARAELREALLGVAALKHLRQLPKAGGRVGLTVGTLGAVIEIAQGLPDLGGPTIWASVAFGTGLCVWMASNMVGQRAQTALHARLRAWSELHRVLEIHISGQWPENLPRNNSPQA
ncbi:MAG: hypothetical protein SFV15_04315 [Polyangiaceae bacterium]|nr:hypothetical protein [Polyangiaceae bacterium]